MKTITACALTAGALSLGMAGQASAGQLAPMVYKANNLRASAWALNDRASRVEARIRCLQRMGYNPVGLKYKAAKMRRKATRLAHRSNRVAKATFNRGYVRPHYSLSYRVVYRYA
ncbi:MAG: hypothetical protein R3E95_14960 [Thiolinea sp.]